MKNILTYDDQEDKLTVTTTYDNTDVLEANNRQRIASPEFGRYKTSNAGLVHVGRIDEGDVIRLKNLGYNLMSPDPEEWKRCLLYIQQNEPYLLTVPGKPFSKKRNIWA